MQRPSDEKLMELITQPHFKRKAGAEPPSNDPIMPTPMVVDVDQIDFYDRNPRRAENPEFENIKHAIKASKGVDWVLNITRRPKAENLMLAAGGNTTLRAVKELWEETGDPGFQQIHCLYKPWTNDNDVLLNHLKENDQRGDLILIDRAKAVRDLRGLIEAETVESLSQREFARQLQERGYSINHPMIGWLNYAVDVLYPAIPFALDAGMGRPQVERLYKLERAFNTTWEVLELEESESKGLFTGVLERHDCEFVDPDLVRTDLEAELMVSADCDLHRAQRLLSMALRDGLSADEVRTRLNETPERVPLPGEKNFPGKEDVQKRPPKQTASPAPAPPPASTNNPADSAAHDSSFEWLTRQATPAQHPTPANPPVNPPVGQDVGAHASKPVAQQPKPLPRSSSASSANPVQDPPFVELPDEPGLTTTPTPEIILSNDIDDLRGQAFRIACKLSDHIDQNGKVIPNIIAPIDGGYGFLVGPMPSGERTLAAGVIWWMLAIVSEQFAERGSAIPHIPPEWSDRPIADAIRSKKMPAWQLQTCEDKAATSEVPLVSMPHLGWVGFNILDDRPWQLWLDLVSITRKIYSIEEPWDKTK